MAVDVDVVFVVVVLAVLVAPIPVGVTVAVRANRRWDLATRASQRRTTKGSTGKHLQRRRDAEEVSKTLVFDLGYEVQTYRVETRPRQDAGSPTDAETTIARIDGIARFGSEVSGPR